jgi:transcriptional regulator with XRE-family HTH domain
MRRSSIPDFDKIDKQIGKLVRSKRRRKGMTQPQLGQMLELSFQQIQRYEQGECRISASRLIQIAIALAVPPQSLIPSSPAPEDGIKGDDPLLDGPDEIRMARAFKKVCPKWRPFWIQAIESAVTKK